MLANGMHRSNLHSSLLAAQVHAMVTLASGAVSPLGASSRFFHIDILMALRLSRKLAKGEWQTGRLAALVAGDRGTEPLLGLCCADLTSNHLGSVSLAATASTLRIGIPQHSEVPHINKKKVLRLANAWRRKVLHSGIGVVPALPRQRVPHVVVLDPKPYFREPSCPLRSLNAPSRTCSRRWSNTAPRPFA